MCDKMQCVMKVKQKKKLSNNGKNKKVRATLMLCKLSLERNEMEIIVVQRNHISMFLKS